MSQPELEYLTFEDILAELGRRFQRVIVVAERAAAGQADERKDEFRFDFVGSITEAVGLLRRADSRLNHRVNVISDGGGE